MFALTQILRDSISSDPSISELVFLRRWKRRYVFFLQETLVNFF